MKYGYYLRPWLLSPYHPTDAPLFSYPEIRRLAISSEKYGFDSIHVNDHLIGFDSERKEPYLEAMVLMSAIAAETKKVKIGHIVLANSFRNPALTAKMVSSIDNISNGRVLLWIGAGWNEEEYRAYGYQFPSAKQRVDELEESLTIFKKLFTEEVTNFKGKFWTLKNCRNFPKPVQKPWPQIVIGAQKDRLTTIACREADGINVPIRDINVLKDRMDFISTKLNKYNRNPEDFEISNTNHIYFVNSEEELENVVNQMIERAKEQNQKLTKEQILKNRFVGYIEDVKEKIKLIEEFGVKKMVIFIRGSPNVSDPLKTFHDFIM